MRIKQLDMIKWLAIIFMVLDHLRLLDLIEPVRYFCYLFGRLAFPAFCFILAYNFFRTNEHYDTRKSDLKYIGSLVAFYFISELPYRYYGEMTFNSTNIMLTLALSFVLLYAFVRKTRSLFLEPSFVCLAVVMITLGLESTDFFRVQYGIAGVFLPLAMYFALKETTAKNIFWVAICAAAINFHTNGGSILNSVNNLVWAMTPVLMSIFGALIPFALIQSNVKIQIPPVTKWGYYFYPVHFAVLGLSRFIYRFIA